VVEKVMQGLFQKLLRGERLKTEPLRAPISGVEASVTQEEV